MRYGCCDYIDFEINRNMYTKVITYYTEDIHTYTYIYLWHMKTYTYSKQMFNKKIMLVLVGIFSRNINILLLIE